MFCSKCGNSVSSEEKFCGNCGNPLNIQANANLQNPYYGNHLNSYQPINNQYVHSEGNQANDVKSYNTQGNVGYQDISNYKKGNPVVILSLAIGILLFLLSLWTMFENSSRRLYKVEIKAIWIVLLIFAVLSAAANLKKKRGMAIAAIILNVLALVFFVVGANI